MHVRSFVDSNVLLYTDSNDAPDKQRQALALIRTLQQQQLGVVSTQALQEYFAVATKKMQVPAAVARRKVELFSRFHTVLPSVDMILTAIDLHRLHALSFWDALIVRAAQLGHCSILFSEDLQHGQRFGEVRVHNPFLD